MLEMMGENDWVTTLDNKVDTDFVNRSINSYDESALEMGLRIKDKTETDLRALTIGDNNSFIKNLYALKYNEVVRINSDIDLRFYSEIVASVIFSYIYKKGTNQDVIILGQQSGVGDNSKTPLLLSELLNIPCITEVMEIDLGKEEGTLVVKSLGDNGILTQLVKTPCVIAVGNTQNCFLRVPTLADKMKYKKNKILEYSIEDFSLEDIIEETKNNYCINNLKKYDNTRNPTIIEGEDMHKKVKKVFKNGLKGMLK